MREEPFNWFTPYGAKGTLKKFFEQPERYAASIQVMLQAQDSLGNFHERSVTLMPLPHPSPLNQKYYAQFPQMLAQRLAEIFP
jgi:uracil-DNA glycosylase